MFKVYLCAVLITDGFREMRGMHACVFGWTSLYDDGLVSRGEGLVYVCWRGRLMARQAVNVAHHFVTQKSKVSCAE